LITEAAIRMQPPHQTDPSVWARGQGFAAKLQPSGTKLLRDAQHGTLTS
jgi:hypothetical protein